jgi:hypothetical protein
MKVGKVEFARRAGYPTLRNPVWSWGATNDADGILLFVWEDESVRAGRGLQRTWAWGGSPSDTERGGIERREHLDRIMAGAPAVAAICTCTDLSEEKAHEKIKSILPTLWHVVRVEAPDERGRVHLLLRHPGLPADKR